MFTCVFAISQEPLIFFEEYSYFSRSLMVVAWSSSLGIVPWPEGGAFWKEMRLLSRSRCFRPGFQRFDKYSALRRSRLGVAKVATCKFAFS